MWPTDVTPIAVALSNRFGVSFSARALGALSNPVIEIGPADVHPHEGFAVRVTVGWRSVTVDFVPGPFASELVRAMGDPEPGGREGFAAIAQAVVAERGRIEMFVNSAPADPLAPGSWPATWAQLKLRLQSPPLVPDPESDDTSVAIRHWAGRLLGMILSLAAAPDDSLEESAEVESGSEGAPEGAVVRVLVNRYERSRRNRAVCLELYGARCCVCDFDFGARYGEIGEGFIHVHHVTPVSQLHGPYVVNPATDLIPVCPNCHAMLHRSDPPLSADALRDRIRTSPISAH